MRTPRRLVPSRSWRSLEVSPAVRVRAELLAVLGLLASCAADVVPASPQTTISTHDGVAVAPAPDGPERPLTRVRVAARAQLAPYPVAGGTAEAIVAGATLNGPDCTRPDASTWRSVACVSALAYGPRVRARLEGTSACTIEEIEVQLELTIIRPQLDPASAPTGSQSRRWNDYAGAVEAQQDQELAAWAGFEDTVRARLTQAANGPDTCAEVSRVARAIVAEEFAAARQAQHAVLADVASERANAAGPWRVRLQAARAEVARLEVELSVLDAERAGLDTRAAELDVALAGFERQYGPRNPPPAIVRSWLGHLSERRSLPAKYQELATRRSTLTASLMRALAAASEFSSEVAWYEIDD
jgi:Bacterial protein of unknown function (DUF922)